MKGILFNHLKLDGHKQMALDQYLLDQSLITANSSIKVRFYSWEGNWVSIGKNQKMIPSKWKNLLEEKKINIVRRPTGGDAVLHSNGLTYSLIWEEAPPKRKTAYLQASQWLIQGFKDMGLPLKFGQQKPIKGSTNCFTTATSADLVDLNGCKRIGSAQLWKKGNLLQHGEILINPSKDLWEDLFSTDPPKDFPLDLSSKEIEKFLIKSLFSSWPEINWDKCLLAKNELEKLFKP